MLRVMLCLAVTLAVASPAVTASAQTAAPAKMKLSRAQLKEMRVKWSQNKAKLKACRKDVRAKGLAGDDRWFFIEECMGKS